MPSKRGRPISTDTIDPSVLRKRLLNANRVRRHRENKRATAALAVSQTPAQLNQVEAIAPRLFSEDQPLDTVSALGLRIDGLDLAQDPDREALRQESEPINEQDTLYATRENRVIAEPTIPVTPVPTARPPEPHLLRRIPHGQTLPTLTSPRAPPPPFIRDSESPEDDCLSPPRTPSLHSPTHSISSDDDLYRKPSPTPLRGPVTNPTAGGSNTEQDPVQLNAAEDPQTPQPLEDSDVEASTYTFESARSVQSKEDEEDEEEAEHEEDEEYAHISSRTYTVLKLYEQMQGDFHGCSQERHDADLRQHMLNADGIHKGLGGTFSNRGFPQVLRSADLLSASEIRDVEMPSPAQWQSMFCGMSRRPDGSRRPRQICLHAEETQAVEAVIAFDVDSLMGFGSSLKLARKGLVYQPAPQSRQNMKTDVHIKMQAGGQPLENTNNAQQQRPHAALLRDIPHFQIGRLVGAEEITLYVMFPHLYQDKKRFESLTERQLERFFNEVFNPAVYKNYESHYTQHLSNTYGHSVSNSKARQVEGRTMETASYQSKQNLTYTLQPDYLDDVWIDVLDTIEANPGLHDFREPSLFFAAKNLKLRFKGTAQRPTMLHVMDDFEQFLHDAVNMHFVYQERFYVDLGKESCCRVGATPSQSLGFNDEAQVYSWKRCCLERNLNWMYDGKPPAKNGPGQRYYNQNLLRDACNLTSVAPKLSKLYQGGLIYSQFYGSVKELSDAAKQVPFQNDGLEELAMDPRILKGAKTAAGGSRRNLGVIERAYCESKVRAHLAITTSRNKSFGLREEHRVSWDLFQSLRRHMDSQVADGPLLLLDDCPSYAWAVKTPLYLAYLEWNANKFAAGFEIVHARCAKDIVTWEQTKMMAMFLRCLRFVFMAHQLQREPALWEGRQDRVCGNPPRRLQWYGLGFRNTLPLYGYAWLEPRFDWANIQFQPQISDNVMFGNHMLAGQYRRRAAQVYKFLNLTHHINLALAWMRDHHGNRKIRKQLTQWMVHTCLQQFRIDVLSGLQKEIRPGHEAQLRQGAITFCHDSLNKIMISGIHLVSGNRCSTKDPQQLGRILFSYDDNIDREFWRDKPYRVLFQRAVAGLKAVGKKETRLHRDFETTLYLSLFKYHWILPYPNSTGLMQTAKRGQRMWYSIEPGDADKSAEPAFNARALRGRNMTITKQDKQMGSDWKWAMKSWQAGQPDALPALLEWDKEKWERWIALNAGMQGSMNQVEQQQ